MKSEDYYTVWDCSYNEPETILYQILDFQKSLSEGSEVGSRNCHQLHLLIRDIDWFERDLLPTYEVVTKGDFVGEVKTTHYSEVSRNIDWERVVLTYEDVLDVDTYSEMLNNASASLWEIGILHI